jgi:hypothetical protein
LARAMAHARWAGVPKEERQRPFIVEFLEKLD